MQIWCTISCIGAPSVRCQQKFDTVGAVLSFWPFDTAPTVSDVVSDLVTSHRTIGHFRHVILIFFCSTPQSAQTKGMLFWLDKSFNAQFNHSWTLYAVNIFWHAMFWWCWITKNQNFMWRFFTTIVFQIAHIWMLYIGWPPYKSFHLNKKWSIRNDAV